MIEIKKVDKYYNKFKKNEIHVINNVSLTLENKGLVALLGPSGSRENNSIKCNWRIR